MKSSVIRALAISVVLASVLLGCSKSDKKTTDSEKGSAGLPTVPQSSWVDQTGRSSVVIDTRDNQFVPENIIVSPGTEIVFENTGRNPHNVIPVTKGDFEEVPVSKLQPKDKVTVQIDGKGEIPYYCSLHGTPKAGMKGRIKISGN